MLVIVGLGNPGRRYRYTRHNAGLMAAEVVVQKAESIESGRWSLGNLELVRADSIRLLVLTPETFMNNSGEAVAPVLKRYGIKPGQVLVMHDDIDIPLGDVRVKRGGGTAGHRGLASIQYSLGDSDYSRIRIGVGRPPAGTDPADYVLSEFTESEREKAAEATTLAAAMALELVTGEGSG